MVKEEKLLFRHQKSEVRYIQQQTQILKYAFVKC